MATKRVQTKPRPKAKLKPKVKPKPAAPYNPAGITTYPSEKAFNTTVDTRARAQLKPALDDIRARTTEEVGANETRNRDIQGYYGYDLAARQAAQTRMQEALTGILGSVGTDNTQAQAGLSAALRPSADANAAAAQQLGAMAPGTDPALASTLAAYGQGNKMGLGGDFGAYLTRSAADIGLTGVEEREAGEKEMGVHRSAMTALDRERKDAMGQLPGLREAARSSMLQELLANSQNKLAWRQFGLGRDQFGETVRSNKSSERLAGKQQKLAESQFGETKKQNRAQNKLNEDQLQITRDELNAKVEQARTDAEATVAQDNAKRFDSAAQWLQGWLAPSKEETGKKKIRKSYDARIKNGFHTVLVQLMTQFGLDRATAYEVMRSAPPYRAKAEKFADAWNMRNYPH